MRLDAHLRIDARLIGDHWVNSATGAVSEIVTDSLPVALRADLMAEVYLIGDEATKDIQLWYELTSPSGEPVGRELIFSGVPIQGPPGLLRKDMSMEVGIELRHVKLQEWGPYTIGFIVNGEPVDLTLSFRVSRPMARSTRPN
jgi:hypothetical protein